MINVWYLFGTLGALLAVLAYFLVASSLWSATGERYNLCNLISSVLMGLSLVGAADQRALVVSVGWMVVSLYMLYRLKRERGKLYVFDWVTRLRPK
ncbi:UNVERIFIED_ORG: hypothetical protein GCAPEGMB_00416 [Vibrio phage V07]